MNMMKTRPTYNLQTGANISGPIPTPPHSFTHFIFGPLLSGWTCSKSNQVLTMVPVLLKNLSCASNKLQIGSAVQAGKSSQEK